MSSHMNQGGPGRNYENGGKILADRVFVNSVRISESGETAMAGKDMLATIFADLTTRLAKSAQILSPYDSHMASFHLDLLKREFLKSQSQREPSADIIMMAGMWLQNRVPGMASHLARLWLSAAARPVISRAGYSLEFWVNARISNYEISDGQWFNLKQLIETLQRQEAKDFVVILCEALGLVYDDVYGSSAAEKTQEIVGLCVRDGRVPELNNWVQKHVNTAVA